MNYKLLNDIDKLNNFGEIELNERVYIFKENDKLYISSLLEDYKETKEVYHYLKNKGFDVIIISSGTKILISKKLNKLYSGIPKKDLIYAYNIFEEDFTRYTYDELIGVEALIKYYKDFIPKTFSPLEKLIFAYDIVKSVKCKEKEVNEVWTGNINYFMDTGYIACAGFSSLLTMILEDIDPDLSVKNNSLIINSIEGHARNIVLINDKKYNFKGIYTMDATWDRSEINNDNYKYFLLNNLEQKKSYNKISSLIFSDYDHILKENKKENKLKLTKSFEETFYKRMNRKLMLSYLNKEKDTLLILKALIIVKKEEGYSKLDTIRSLHRNLKNDEESKKLYSKKVRSLVSQIFL